MFYGTTFEVLTSHFIIPACLNNIANGRRYDQLEKMELSKYLRIHKANRGNPFQSNDKLSFLLEGIDPQIRNASHHADIKLLKGRDIVEYKAGNKSETKTMSYAEYIWLCNRLIVSLFVSLALEIRLRNYA